MNVWDKWEYDITYIDKNEMSKCHVLTDTAHLGIIIDKIIYEGAFDIRIR